MSDSNEFIQALKSFIGGGIAGSLFSLIANRIYRATDAKQHKKRVCCGLMGELGRLSAQIKIFVDGENGSDLPSQSYPFLLDPKEYVTILTPEVTEHIFGIIGLLSELKFMPARASNLPNIENRMKALGINIFFLCALSMANLIENDGATMPSFSAFKNESDLNYTAMLAITNTA